MDHLRHHRWVELFDRLMELPRLQRAARSLSYFAVGQTATSIVSLWAVHRSGSLDMAIFTSVIVAGILVVAVSAALLTFIARDDPQGEGRTAHVALLGCSTAYGLFGVSMAHVLGFWASPFTLLPAVTVLISGILFGRVYGWTVASVSVALAVVLEGLRLADLLDYAPALLDRSIDETGAFMNVVGTSVPLVAFTVVTVVLAFGVLATVDRQRTALATSHDMIRRYVPAQVADAVLEHGEETTRLERRKLTIFFSDVVGFTELTERMEPEELARVLDDYFSEMTAIAERYDGTIDELIGDAVLIFFGAPTSTDDHDHALRAVRMAVEMQERVLDLNRRWEAAGIDASLSVRVGINTGIVMVGNVGSGERRKYAALGRGVNLAARLQTHCPPGRILLSHAAWLLVRDDVPCTERGEVELKGVGRPTRIHEVT